MLTAYAVKPIKWLWFGIVYTAVGAIIIFLFNLVGTRWGIFVPINLATAFITGLLGLPGLVCLILIKLWIIGS